MQQPGLGLTGVRAAPHCAADNPRIHRLGEGEQMEFHIRVPGAISDIGVIEDAMRTVDPSALVDIDPARPAVRVAASVDLDQLLSVLRQSGYPVARDDVTQVPSTCCGGCSG